MKIQILEHYKEFDLALSMENYMYLCFDQEPEFCQENFQIGKNVLIPNVSKIIRISHSPTGTHTHLHLASGYLLYLGTFTGTDADNDEKARLVVCSYFSNEGKLKLNSIQKDLFGGIGKTGYPFIYYAFWDFGGGVLAVSKSNLTVKIFRNDVELINE